MKFCIPPIPISWMCRFWATRNVNHSPGSAATSVKCTFNVLFVLSVLRTNPTSSTISAVNPSVCFSERMEAASLSVFKGPFAGLAGESMEPQS